MHEREVVTYVRVRTQLQRLDGYGMGAQQEAAPGPLSRSTARS